MGSNGEGWPVVSGHVSGYGPDSEDEDDSSKDGSLKESGNGDDLGSGNGGSDAEGVWSPDIEQSFQEALAIYPPCGRRKIILSDEGKMYGRNELIARYIKIRTGKTRTRKQVSSHIQVLARRKARETQAKVKSKPSVVSNQVPGHSVHHHLNPALHHHASHVATAAAGLAALGIAPNSVPHHFWQQTTGRETDIKPFIAIGSNGSATHANNSNHAINMYSTKNDNYINNNNNNNNNSNSLWEGRCIASSKLRLVEFTAFTDTGSTSSDRHVFVRIEGLSYSDPVLEDIDLRQISDKFPSNKGGLRELYDKGPENAFFLVKFWADLNIPSIITDEGNAFYGVTSHFEATESMNLSCSTKVCSFGKQVVEKLEMIDSPIFINGRYFYRLDRSEMCEYMINFIHKLKDLPEKYMMNSVLENFTILQIVSNRDTNETLLCIAFVFEVSVSDNGTQHHIYRLIKPNATSNH